MPAHSAFGLSCAGLRFQADRLKVNPRSELEDTRIGDCVDLSGSGVIGVRRVARQDARVHPCELRVIPGVEGLRPELDPGTFFDVEILVQRQVPVVAARAFHDALRSIAPGERSWLSESVRTEPLAEGMRI